MSILVPQTLDTNQVTLVAMLKCSVPSFDQVEVSDDYVDSRDKTAAIS